MRPRRGNLQRQRAQVIATNHAGVNHSRAWGATRWTAGNRALVVLSDRYGYRDTFWFSLMHEIGHILHHPRRRTFLNLAETGDDHDGLEDEANRFAAATLIPDRYLERLFTADTAERMRALALEAEVDVSIIAGRRGYVTGEWNKVQRLRKRLDIRSVAQAADAPLGSLDE